jgi:hypothetical protein
MAELYFSTGFVLHPRPRNPAVVVQARAIAEQYISVVYKRLNDEDAAT